MCTAATNVARYLLEGKDPSRTALIGLDRDWTYGEIASNVDRIARYLLASGAAKGDRVVLVAGNSMFWVAAYLGTLKAGLVCVPIPPTINREDFQYICENTEAKILFVQTRFVSKLTTSVSQRIISDVEVAGRPDISPIHGLDMSPQVPVTPAIGNDDLACLMFTSGSTGKPRGVMVSHGNIKSNTDSIIEYLKLTPNDRIMTVLPFHYCFGTSLLHTHLRVGGTLVLDHRFMYPEKILQRMRETECTGFAGVPSHYQVLLRRTSLRKMSFPTLRYVQQAGGHLPAPLVRELQEALPQAKIYVMYGQTEATARLSYLPPEFVMSKSGSIGKGIPGVKLSVLGETGQPVKPGEVGEIVAEGPNITKGYWRSPDLSAAVFREGKLHTGDNAIVGEDGFIFIVGRARDFIKCGGIRTSCKHIEDILLKCKEVVEVAVVGIPDPTLGEAVRAFVVPSSSAEFDLGAFREFCKLELPFQLVPRDIIPLKGLPKNDSGKLLKENLPKLSNPGQPTGDSTLE
jgi:acyl-CoA synthetase (AMP-forming)/AMP-acid ligase II